MHKTLVFLEILMDTKFIINTMILLFFYCPVLLTNGYVRQSYHNIFQPRLSDQHLSHPFSPGCIKTSFFSGLDANVDLKRLVIFLE